MALTNGPVEEELFLARAVFFAQIRQFFTAKFQLTLKPFNCKIKMKILLSLGFHLLKH